MRLRPHYASYHDADEYADGDDAGDLSGPRPLSQAELQALEDELLARLAAAGGAAAVVALFGGFRPLWALDTFDRLEAAGLVCVLPDRRTALTEAGRTAAARAAREQARQAADYAAMTLAKSWAGAGRGR